MIGIQELILIIVVVILFFGPDKLPEIAKSIAIAIGEFKKGEFEVLREESIIEAEVLPIHDVPTLAKILGIQTNGKNDVELWEEMQKIYGPEKIIEIVERINKNAAFKKDISSELIREISGELGIKAANKDEIQLLEEIINQIRAEKNREKFKSS